MARINSPGLARLESGSTEGYFIGDNILPADFGAIHKNTGVFFF
jgi:hypothetical protein